AHFHRGNPCLYTGEAVLGVIALFLRAHRAPAAARRLEAALARMRAVPRLLAEWQANLRRVPRPWIERAVRECIGARAFFETGAEILIHDHAIGDPRFRDAAGAAAAAFAGFRSHLEGTLAPAAHEDCGCGGEAFDLLLRRGHFLEIDAAAVRAAAPEEIARCEAALAAGAGEVGARTRRAALGQLTGRHPAAERSYARYGAVWGELCLAAVADRLLT